MRIGDVDKAREEGKFDALAKVSILLLENDTSLYDVAANAVKAADKEVEVALDQREKADAMLDKAEESLTKEVGKAEKLFASVVGKAQRVFRPIHNKAVHELQEANHRIGYANALYDAAKIVED